LEREREGGVKRTTIERMAMVRDLEEEAEGVDRGDEVDREEVGVDREVGEVREVEEEEGELKDRARVDGNRVLVLISLVSVVLDSRSTLSFACCTSHFVNSLVH